MSRKTIIAVLGFLTVVLVFLESQFDIAIEATGFMAALGVVITYLLFQAKMDIKKIGRQFDKFKSKKFWIAFVSILVPAINQALGLNVPVEIVVGVMGFVMTIIFGKEFKEAK